MLCKSKYCFTVLLLAKQKNDKKMTKVQNPIIGAASGSTNGMIFQRYDGKNIMRRTPFFYNYRKTAAQQNAQNTFKQNNLIPIPPTFDFLDILYPFKPRKFSKHIQFQIDIKQVKNKIKYEKTGLKFVTHLKTTKSNLKTNPFIIANNEDPLNPFLRIRYNSNAPEEFFEKSHYMLLIIIDLVLNNYTSDIIAYLDNIRHIKHKINPALTLSQSYILLFMQLNTHNYQSQFSHQPVLYSLLF